MTLFIRNRNLYLGASVLVTTHEGRQGFNERVSNTPYFEDAGGHTLANFTRPYDTTVKRFVVTGGTSDGLDYANSSHTGVPNNWRTGIHEITVMASINWTAMPANGGGAFLYDAGTGALPWAIWQSTTTANWIFQISTGTEHTTSTLAAATGWKVLVGRYLDNQKFSLDQWTTLGVKGTSVTGTNFVGPIVYPPGTALALGRFQSYFSGSSAWAGMWPRSLSDGEVAAVIHAAHGGNSFFSSAPKTIYLSGSTRTNFDADVTNTPAEFGFEATSVLVRIVESPNNAEFGWEGTSASVALPESVTPAEFGFEATSAAVRIVDNPNSAEFGWEGTSAGFTIVDTPNSAEFGYEATSASLIPVVPVTPAEFAFEATSVAVTIVDTPNSAEFGFEATSAAISLPESVTPAEFGFEATSVAVRIVDTPNSAEFGFEATSAAVTLPESVTNAEFGYEGTSASIRIVDTPNSAEFGWEGTSASVALPESVTNAEFGFESTSASLITTLSVVSVSAKFGFETSTVALRIVDTPISAEFGFEVTSASLTSFTAGTHSIEVKAPEFGFTIYAFSDPFTNDFTSDFGELTEENVSINRPVVNVSVATDDIHHPRDFGFEVSSFTLQRFVYGLTPNNRLLRVEPDTDRIALTRIYPSYLEFPLAGIDRVVYVLPIRRIVNVIGTGVPINEPNVPPIVPVTLFDIHASSVTMGFDTDGVTDTHQNLLRTNNPQFGFEVATASFFQLHTLDVGKPEFGAEFGAIGQIVQGGINVVPAEFGVETKSATMTQRQTVIAVAPTTGWESFGATNISQSGGGTTSHPNIVPTTDLRNWSFLVGGSTTTLNAIPTADQHNRYDLNATGGRSGIFENVPFTTGTQYSISVDAVGTTPFSFNEWTGISSGNPPNSDNQNSPTFTPTATSTRFTWTFTAAAASAAGGVTSIGIVYNNLSGTVSGTNTFSKFKVEVGAPTAYVDPIPVSQAVTTQFTKGGTDVLPMSTFQISGDAITAIHTQGFTDLTFTVNVSAQTITITNTSTATTGLKSGNFTISGAFGNTSNQSNIAVTLNAVGTGRVYAIGFTPGGDTFRWSGENSGWAKERIDMWHSFGSDSGSSATEMDAVTWSPTPNGWAVTCQFVTAKGVLDMAAAARGDYNATWKTWFQDWKNVRSNISVIRIWQECNNTDFPWCQASSPQQFIDAWRNVATQARSVFPNTLLEWNLNQGGTTGNNQPNGSIPTTGSNPTHPLYPGDDLVDVVGLDSYEQWDPTLSGGGINHKNLSAFAVARGKKFGISEWAGNGGNCGQNSTSTPCNGAYITNVASFLDGLGATAAYQWYFDNGYCSGNNGGTVLYTTANPQSGDACPASTLQAAWNNSSFGTLAYGGTLPFISQVASPPPAPPPPAPAPPPPAPPPAPPGTISPNIVPTTDFRNWTFLIAGSTLALDGALTADQHNRYDLSATGVRSGVFENVPFVTGTQYSISVDVLGTTPFQFNEWTGISSGNPPNSDNQNSPTFTPTATVTTRATWTFTANAPSAAGGSTSIGIVYNNLGGSVSGTNIYSKFKVEVGGPTAYVDPNPVSKNVTTSFIKGNNITLPMSTFQASGDAITAIHTSGFTDITFNLNISAQTVTIANTSTATTGAKSGTFTLSGAFNNTSNQSTIAITLNAVGSGRLYAVSVSDGTSPALWASEVLWPKQPIDMLDGFTDQTDSYWDGDGQNWNPAPNAHMMTIQWQNPNGGSFDHAAAARGDYNAGWLGFLKTGNRQTMPIAVVRIWQENNLNGSTFGQFANPTDFKNAWNNFAAQVRTAYPNAKIDWNLNQGEHDSGHSGNGSQTVFDTYPGDTYVDIVSIDSYYNSDPNPVSAHPNGYDLTTVANFAKSKGKLFGIGEWAAGKKDPNNGSQGDPNDQCESSYITAVANFLDGLGATAAYQSYYDTGYPNNGGNVLYTTSGGASSPFGCPQNTLRDTWNNSSFGSKPFGGTWSNVLKPLTPVAKPVPPNPTSTIPTRVVIDSVGVNTHIDFNNGTSAGYSSIQNVINSINFLGLKHIRDCPAQTADLSGARAWSVVAAGTGAKFLAFIGQTSLVNAQTELDMMDTLAGQGILYGIDGPNEWDDPFPISQGVDLTKAIAFQQKVWDKGIKLQLPVMNLSIGAGFSAANNFVGDYGVVGDLSAICTCANAHTYQVVGQTVTNTINRLNGLAQMAAPGNPNITTEIGWDNNNFTEANAAIYAQQVIFAGILKSDVKCYYYALFDDIAGKFGIMRTDGTPKPAGQAVHNVMAVLADTGVGPDRSDTLTYTTTGKISNDSIIVMQKSTGTFQLAIWNEIDAAHNVTINFGAVKSSIKTYIPLNSVSAITTATNVQSVSVSVGNPVVIVEMTP